MIIPILYLVLWLAVIGCVAYLIVTYIPMLPIFKTLIYIVVAIACILLLINFLGGHALL